MPAGPIIGVKHHGNARDMRNLSRVLAAPFSPPEHPALSVVEALWRPAWIDYAKFADECVRLAKKQVIARDTQPLLRMAQAWLLMCTATSGRRPLRWA